MKQRLFAFSVLAGLAVALVGCAQVTDASLLVFSTRTPAIAVVNGQLLQGEVLLQPDRTGSATLKSAAQGQATGADPSVVSSCVGQLRYTSTVAGSIDLRCNGGIGEELRFTMLSETRGYAYGQSPAVPISLTYGLTVTEAKAYLKLPPGKQLVARAGSNDLELR